MRRTIALAGVWLSVVFVGSVVTGCDGPDAPPVTGGACTSDDECDTSFVCRLGRCRGECAGYRDCGAGSLCIVGADTGDEDSPGVCRLEDEAACESDDTCPAGTACFDGSCRAECTDAGDCGGTACVDGECEDPATTRLSCDDVSYCSSGVCEDEGCDDDVLTSAGGVLTCVMRVLGEIDCAGSDAMGALGDGETIEEGGLRPLLGEVVLPDDALAVAAGGEHACALLVDGSVHCWGRGDTGQIGASTGTDLPQVAIEAGTDETLVIQDLSAGARHTCVRRASGAVECFGADDLGQLGDAATHPACESGAPCSRTPVAVDGLTDAMLIDSGAGGTCALRDGGAVTCWGALASITGLPSATVLAVGGGHACVLDAEGQVVCAGENAEGQAGVGASPLTTPTVIDLPMPAYEIDAGTAFTCALLTDDTVWCWGANGSLQLGREGAGGATPVAIAGLPRSFELDTGAAHACARTLDGESWCWGADESGQLADGEATAAGHATPRRAVRNLGGMP